ncbi:hypothetical protein D3C80_1722110 [compost metagenome]
MPPAAPATATASTLSKLITASATMMVLIAARKLAPAFTSWASSGSGNNNLMPIHSNSAAPTSFRYGRASSCMAKNSNAMRNRIAPATPPTMAWRRCSAGRCRQASAMTTALSPPNKMSMAIICISAIQKTGSLSHSISPCLRYR